jgi:hypothetical protein
MAQATPELESPRVANLQHDDIATRRRHPSHTGIDGAGLST